MSVRIARAADVPRVAGLKVAWSNVPTDPTDAGRVEYIAVLERWMREHDDTVVCAVAERGEDLVGMAWLVVFERAPDLHAHRRLSGDVQSVYVLPEHRSRGIGRRLVRALLEAADARGVGRVTVSANADAAPMYRSLGFDTSPLLLERRHPD